MNTDTQDLVECTYRVYDNWDRFIEVSETEERDRVYVEINGAGVMLNVAQWSALMGLYYRVDVGERVAEEVVE